MYDRESSEVEKSYLNTWIFGSLTPKLFSHEIIPQYLREVIAFFISDRRTVQSNWVEHLFTKSTERILEMTAVIGGADDFGFLVVNRLWMFRQSIGSTLCTLDTCCHTFVARHWLFWHTSNGSRCDQTI